MAHGVSHLFDRLFIRSDDLVYQGNFDQLDVLTLQVLITEANFFALRQLWQSKAPWFLLFALHLMYCIQS